VDHLYCRAVATTAPPEGDRHAPGTGYRWTATLVAGRSAAIVGDVGDELVLAIRRGGAARAVFVSPEAFDADAPPDELRADFDVVLVAADGESDGAAIDPARALLAPQGQLIVVVPIESAGLPPDAAETSEGRDVQAFRARISHLEKRRTAVLDELLSCEGALIQSEEFAQAVHDEILLMRQTVSWRVTRPLRWVRARARRE